MDGWMGCVYVGCRQIQSKNPQCVLLPTASKRNMLETLEGCKSREGYAGSI